MKKEYNNKNIASNKNKDLKKNENIFDSIGRNADYFLETRFSQMVKFF